MSLIHVAKGTKAPKAAPKPRPKGGELPTGPSLERYARATIKQIVLHFEGMQYLSVINRLRHVMAVEKVKTHREAFLKLLDAWEEEHGTAE